MAELEIFELALEHPSPPSSSPLSPHNSSSLLNLCTSPAGALSPRSLSLKSPHVARKKLNSSQVGSYTSGYFTCGRPPWFTYSKNDQQVKKRPAFVIGVSGGTACGKTTVCHRIVEELDIPWAVILSQDSFYKDLNGENLERAHRGDYNFDHPDAFDYQLMVDTLKKLKQGENVEVPIYDFVTHSRRTSTVRVYGADVILFEGILIFYDNELCDLMDMKIFVDTDADLRLARRLRRDIAERGRTVESVLQQYERFVKPAFDDYIAPTKRKADIIIPNVTYNHVAINLLVEHLKGILEKRGAEFRNLLLESYSDDDFDPTKMENLVLLRQTPLIKSVHTLLRDSTQDRETFIFNATRLTRLLIESALSKLPFMEKAVETPVGSLYHGKLAAAKICGVSVVRAGESMEVALQEVCKDIRIGKLLIQTSPVTREPLLVYSKLPRDISQRYVLLMDPMIGTAATALMAIRVVLDHGVPEDHIFFLTLVTAPEGIRTIAYAFPQVKLFTSAIDKEVTSNYFILPGMGNFGDRYFGTGKE